MPTELETLIGYCFENAAILKEALTHKSFAGEHRAIVHNERLEFLGDSILGAIVADYIYCQCPHSEEGVLSKIKSNLVSRHNLFLWARDLDLGRFLRLGHGELATGGRQRDSILSNAMEAVIGAVYLDGGYEAARQVVLPWVKTQKLTQDGGDYKSMFQEYVQKRTRGVPSYEIVQTVGPEHDKVFTVEVTVDGKRYGLGKGKSRKQAEQDAAHNAMQHLKK